MMFTKQKHEKAPGRINNKSSFPGHLDSSEDKQADIQGNTFAFGVILLEIISGRLPYCKDKGYLIDWVRHSTLSLSHCDKEVNILEIDSEVCSRGPEPSSTMNLK